MKSPKKLTAAFALLGCLAILPAYLRAVTVSGPSDAPTLLLGDQLLINFAAYRVDVSWKDASGNECGFLLERRTETGGFTQVASLPTNTTSWTANAPPRSAPFMVEPPSVFSNVTRDTGRVESDSD